MSDECMHATQDVEGSIDYTNKEYLRMVQHVQNACQRLSRNGESTLGGGAVRVRVVYDDVVIWVLCSTCENFMIGYLEIMGPFGG